MVKILILTHGSLAHELLRAAETIAGANGCLASLALDWDDPPPEAELKTRRAIERLAPGEGGLLILTDMYGGTPHNVAMRFQEPGRVEVVTGVNLPMVLRLGCAPREGLSVPELAEWIADKGRHAIRHTAVGQAKGVE